MSFSSITYSSFVSIGPKQSEEILTNANGSEVDLF